MPVRKMQFINGEFYHVFNRGVDKRKIFSDAFDLQRFFQSMDEFNVINPIGSIFQNSFNKIFPNKYTKFYFFGPSFAVRKENYKRVGGFIPFIEIKKSLKLFNWPDDCYLSLALWKKGKVILLKNKNTKVFARDKHFNFHGIFVRPFEQTFDGVKLFKYFNKKLLLFI